MKKIFLYSMLLGCILILSILLCKERNKDGKLISGSLDVDIKKNELTIKGINLTETYPEKGIRWELQSDDLIYERDNDTLYFNSFHLTFYADTYPKIELWGKRGRYIKDEGRLLLSRDLRVVSEDGYRLKCKYAEFSAESNMIRLWGDVELIGPNIKLTGEDLLIHLRKKRDLFLYNVKAYILKGLLSI
ncbi:MAG TPA: LPS export ABC transporter periplasmic protein LptC [Desulfobacteraceae bacterium]|nr:LPS export ABC transporter periplasmic protein LptC [Desulfobacteraceae bacterium]